MKLFKAVHSRSKKKEMVNVNDTPEEIKTDMSVIDSLKQEGKLDTASLSRRPSENDVRKYIDAHGDRIVLADNQNSSLRREYSQVTDYLTDIQKIDYIKDDDAKRLFDDATAIIRLEQERLKCQKRDNRLSKKQYDLMEQYSDVMNKELNNMKKREKYQLEIKSDMRNLEGEKESLKNEQHDILIRQGNMRNIAIGTGVLITSVFALLAIIWTYSGFDMTFPFVISVAVAGMIALYIISGMRKVRINLTINEKKLNKAITLLNSVKIKYINNTALLDYLCGKYSMKNSVEMEHIWNQYLRAKADEQTLSTNAAETKEHKNNLEVLLRTYGVKDTEVWIYQAAALLDSREMVEVRHKLNVRRKKLREQIAYNDDQIRQDSYVLWKILKSKPQYKAAVSEMMKRNAIEKLVVTSLRR